MNRLGRQNHCILLGAVLFGGIFLNVLAALLFRPKKAEVRNECDCHKKNENLQLKPSSVRQNGPVCKGSKVGVLLFVPHQRNNYYVIQFVAFIYASWKFITKYASDYASIPYCSSIDLLVYCDEPTCLKRLRNVPTN